MTFDFTKTTTPKGDYYNETTGISDNTETTLLADCGIVGRFRGVAGYAESDKTGELKIYFINRNNVAVLDQTVTVTAGVLSVFDFDRALIRYKITFTRTDSPYTGDATARVEIEHYGAGK